jgi:hypothetical protein
MENEASTKNKDFHVVLASRVLRTKDNLAKWNWHDAKRDVVFIIKMNQFNIYLLTARYQK